MTKTAPARGVPIIRKGPPEIAIEWIDVTIDIRVRSHPVIHPKTISRGQSPGPIPMVTDIS